ncbi:MAG: flavin reductase family protein, partial [Candidatus Izemoplasmataceae bacterium]
LVSTKNSDDSVNIAPFSYFNLVTIKPIPRIAISIAKKIDASLKDTALNIQKKKLFRVHLVTEDIIESMNETATNLPYGRSELSISGFTIDPNDDLGLKIFEASASFLCELGQIISFESADLYIAKILSIDVDEAFMTSDHEIDILKLNVVGRLSKNDYNIVKDKITIRRKTL